jgi:hypothetical protein
MSEVAMKAYKVLILGLIFVSIPVLAQGEHPASLHDSPDSATMWTYNDEYIQKAIKNYEAALSSSNNGLVESALAHLTYIQINFPQTDLTKIRATIADLAESGSTPVIRYKAYLATIVLQNPASIMSGLKAESSDSNQFFSAVASKVQRTLLGANIQ